MKQNHSMRLVSPPHLNAEERKHLQNYIANEARKCAEGRQSQRKREPQPLHFKPTEDVPGLQRQTEREEGPSSAAYAAKQARMTIICIYPTCTLPLRKGL